MQSNSNGIVDFECIKYLCCAFIKMSLNFILKGSINISQRDSGDFCHERGDKSLALPVKTPSIDAYISHQASMTLNDRPLRPLRHWTWSTLV